MNIVPTLAPSESLYHPDFEHDSCGTGFVVDIGGHRSFGILRDALTAVANLTHRGAVDADAKTGDGAGIMTQIPYAVLQRSLFKLGVRLDNPYDLGVGMVFLPRTLRRVREACKDIVNSAIAKQELPLFGWRKVPVDSAVLGDKAALTEPVVFQVLTGRPSGMSGAEYERRLYLVRRESEYLVRLRGIKGFYVPSFSHRTIVYKGLFVGPQLPRYYKDLQNPRFVTALAVFHQRYSTNTFPNWFLAQPFRFVAHNGEINTIKGNVNWMAARSTSADNDLWHGRLKNCGAIVDPDGSDSAKFDNVLDLYVNSGRTLPHALMMMIPEAHELVPQMDDGVRAFYKYHDCLTEPWDGPAAMAFSDGLLVGMALDRNGLRPARYTVTDDGHVVMGSEVGILDIDDRHVVEKGRLGPGQMFLVDTRSGTVRRNEEIKKSVSEQSNYRAWVTSGLQFFNRNAVEDVTVGENEMARTSLIARQLSHGFTKESIEAILKPMVETGKEPLGSMGDDTPIAVLSARQRPLYGYFKQLFAQVTNPPIDHLREALVMSLTTFVGGRSNILAETPQHACLLAIDSPIVSAEELEAIAKTFGNKPVFLPARFPAADGSEGLTPALRALTAHASKEAEGGHSLIVLSHQGVDERWAPIPMLLAVGAVHHHLIRQGLRFGVNIVADTDDAYDVHHVATLIGYGADLVVPRLAYDIVRSITSGDDAELDPQQALQNYRHSLEEGLRKIMSKMGISCVSSYRGAQIFEALGLNEDVVSDCFAGTASRIGGITYSGIADNALELHARAFPTPVGTELVEEGVFRYRKGLEYHALNPDVFKALHQAVRTGEKDRFGAYVNLVESRPPTHVRDLLDFAATEPISIDDVEPTETIVKRFMTGAMSFGAISLEAHTTMAIAMNRLGAKSNSGEGGEDPERFHRLPNGDMPSSAVKQVASARFGVTPEYLASAKELEIKMAQGSKPGEGGQLPGHKVTEEIARTRHSVPGVTLISPPPHHDIYSIEDLAQLIYDLKHANPRAKVGVKLVSEAGIGTIAAGVAKAYADVIHISGMEGGTGASPWSSIKNAGLPWELGLAEAQQVLMMNGLRGRVLLRVDGGLKTGRDVIIAALLGAEEYGFGTVSLIAAGCVMARQCHLNSCPVGVASQRKDLRDRFPGKPEHVVSLMLAVADQVRGILASLGARSMKEIIGRVDLLVARKVTTHHNWEHLDLRQILAIADPTWQAPRVSLRGRNNKGDTSLDDLILLDARDVIRGREHRISLSYEIRNTNRAVGAMVAGEIAYEHGDRGIPSGSIECRFTGTAGQSFGAFCIEGLRLVLTGQANDGVGKGMHGGEIAIAPPAGASFVAGDNVLIGNTALYGATGGALYAAGQAGERFAVRNSGATTVVEGVGDHGCEYMTGGTVVILGHTGRNFAAGMTGGVAYVYDPDDRLRDLYNPQLVDLFRLSEENSAKIVRRLIEKHTGETGSERGSYILEKWDAQIGHFWVVQPHEATPIPEAEKARGGKVRHLPVVERVEGEHVDAKVGQPSHATVA